MISARLDPIFHWKASSDIRTMDVERKPQVQLWKLNSVMEDQGYSDSSNDVVCLSWYQIGFEHGNMGIFHPRFGVDLLAHCRRLPRKFLKKLNDDIVEFCGLHAQSEELYYNKLKIHKNFQDLLRSRFPQSGLYIIGSSVTGLCTKNSDMDLCLMVSREKLKQDNALEYLSHVMNTINNNIPVTSLQLIPARVSILKFICPDENIHCDLNVNNPVAIRNTYLLYHYVQSDPRLQPLIIAVKMWAKQHEVGSAWNGGLSSYSWELLVINYLQCCFPPVLPCLHRLAPLEFGVNAEIDITNMIPQDIDKTGEKSSLFRSVNHESLAELFLGFFRYYSYVFDFQTKIISVRMGGVLHRDSVQDKSVMRKWIFIEEPYDLTNTASSVSTASQYERIINAFLATYEELITNFDLHAVMHPTIIEASSSNKAQ